MKLLSLTLLCALITGVASAQTPEINEETSVDYTVLHQWLHSSDPRLIAWAADFAQRRHDAKIVAEMPELLEHWIIPAEYGVDQAQAAQSRAVLAVLDTLIQENAEVTVAAIHAVAASFPAQAAILASRLPLSTSRSTLFDWTYGTTGGWGGRTLARIASMLLAKDPLLGTVGSDYASSRFVASVVSESEENIHISVRADSNGSDVGLSGGCGDSVGRGAIRGWPEVFAYGLEEGNNRSVGGTVLVDLNGDQIVFVRRPGSGGWGSCGGVEPLNPATRHRLLAYWLGVSEKEMSWQPEEFVPIQWTDLAAYREKLGMIVELQRHKLSETVEELRHRGFLMDGETAMPRLVMTIQCEMKPCPLP